MNISEGQMIGQYRVLEPLGQGGMASVFKAYHARLDRMVAIKMIHRQFLEDRNFLVRFEREAQIVAKLEHPNIVPVHDYAEHEGMPYIVMKYVDGATLKDVLEKGMLATEDSLHVLNGVTAALDYAHGRGVLHRDIKPSNVMIDTSGIPYLTDFGLARLALGGATTLSADMLIGTPFYMSPEQARGDESLDARTDVYSLGIMVYELMTGTVPYSGATPYSIIHQQITASLRPPTEFNPNIPAETEAVIMKALAKERDARYGSAGALLKALKQSLPEQGGTPVVAPPPETPATPPPLRESIILASHARRASAAKSAAAFAATPPLASEPRPAPTPARPQVSQTIERPTRPQKRSNSGLLWVLGALAVLILLVALVVMARRLNDVRTEILPTVASLGGSATAVAAVPATDTRPTLPPTWTTAPQPTVAPTQPPRGSGGQQGSGGPPGQRGPLTLLDIPILTVEQAANVVDAGSTEARDYIALFRALLVEESSEDLEAILREGEQYAEDPTIYWASAAHAADEAGSPGAALIIYRAGLTERVNDTHYLFFREEAGRWLYDFTQQSNSLTFFELQSFAEVRQLLDVSRGVSPIYNAIRARALLEHNNLRLAEALINLALEQSPTLPEALLVQGEIAAAQGDLRGAEQAWRGAMEAQNAPIWVRERADALLRANAP
jgi:serine/threonine protein kinase